MRWFSFLSQKTTGYRKKSLTGSRNRLIILLLFALTGTVALSGDASRWRRKTLAVIPQELAVEEVDRVASGITVQIHGETFLGSGVILQQTERDYLVITNQHVLRASPAPYRVKTPDGLLHRAKVVTPLGADNTDLALLNFTSDRHKYRVAVFGNYSQLKQGERVFAAGFPNEALRNALNALPGFSFTTGEIAVILDKPLQEGYQIGYTNDVQKGMSGGPLLNRYGHLVGINGKHAYPLWDAPDFYEDNSQPCQSLQDLITRSSLAIPVEKVVNLLRQGNFPEPSFSENAQNEFLFSTIARDDSVEKAIEAETISKQYCQ